MTYRSVNQIPGETPEIEQILEAVLLQALEIAREKLDAGEDLIPFTSLAVGETLFTETHPAENPEDCFKLARHTVQNARGALAYAFCYDGYVDTDQGKKDAIIAEGGVPGAEEGHAVGYLYTTEGEGEQCTYKLEEGPLYIGQAPNFMEFTLIVEEDEDIDDGYGEDADGRDDDVQEDIEKDGDEYGDTGRDSEDGCDNEVEADDDDDDDDNNNDNCGDGDDDSDDD